MLFAGWQSFLGLVRGPCCSTPNLNGEQDCVTPYLACQKGCLEPDLKCGQTGLSWLSSSLRLYCGMALNHTTGSNLRPVPMTYLWFSSFYLNIVSLGSNLTCGFIFQCSPSGEPERERPQVPWIMAMTGVIFVILCAWVCGRGNCPQWE